MCKTVWYAAECVVSYLFTIKKLFVLLSVFQEIFNRKQEVTVELRLRQEVLARFPDDAWFYFGVVWAIVDKNIVYTILDGAGNLTDITRSDMFLEEDEGYAAIEVN